MPGQVSTHQCKLLGTFQCWLIRRLKLRRGAGQLGIACSPIGCLVHHRTVRRGQLRFGHLPGTRCRLNHHVAGSRAGHTHTRNTRCANAQATAGDLLHQCFCCLMHCSVYGCHQSSGYLCACQQVSFAKRAVGVFVFGRSLHKADVCPIGIHFIGQHLGQHRLRALTHFTVRYDGRDFACFIDLHPHTQQGVTVFGDQIRHLFTAITATQRDTDNQSSTR